MLLPGQRAARIRQKSADILVRYLGGDPSLVGEIMRNRGYQEYLAEHDPSSPARLFGETIESESLKRKREELEGARLEHEIERLKCESERMETELQTYKTDSAQTLILSLRDIGMQIDDS